MIIVGKKYINYVIIIDILCHIFYKAIPHKMISYWTESEQKQIAGYIVDIEVKMKDFNLLKIIKKKYSLCGKSKSLKYKDLPIILEKIKTYKLSLNN